MGEAYTKSESEIEIQHWLISHLAARLNIDVQSISLDRPFFNYGLSSVLAVELAGDIERKLKIPLSPVLFYQYTNIGSLSTYLASQLVRHNNGEDDAAPQDSGDQQAAIEYHNSLVDDPVAIIGMSCRFPGAPDTESFWDLLQSGRSGISKIPDGRWPDLRDIEEYNTISRGGFLESLDEFDPLFFGVSPREAEHIDPQQRLLLELGWEALENANIRAESIRGKQVGVFIGISSNDYARLQSTDVSKLTSWTGTGNSLSIASNRISYTLDLKGPSISIDTACSSSLVAVHQAVKSLLHGECEMAIAGGVNLMVHPDLSIVFARAGMLAQDGKCKTFDKQANGYVRGEGGGVVLVKRLSKALADGDRILALIRGSAVNHDGSSNGLTAPNGLSQAAVIRKALKKAGVQPGEIDYIETHGTGTSLGDPIEVEALVSVFGNGKEKRTPYYLGAVKTNIGHLEAAAGIAGLIKTVLVLQHNEIPQNLNFEELNEKISIAPEVTRIPKEHIPGDEFERKFKLAGVSSFGFGGTNAHLIVEAYNSLTVPEKTVARPMHLLTLSARTPGALKELCLKYSEMLKKPHNLADVFFSANAGRSQFEHRLALVAKDAREAIALLEDHAGEKSSNGMLFSGHAKLHKNLKIAFLFTGQGSQYPNIAKELYESQPAFKNILDQCNLIYQDITGNSILKILYDDETGRLVNETEYTQPVLFCIGYSLAELLQSWGIHPSFVMGHSLGEYIAACVSGLFSLEDGIRFVTERGKLMSGSNGRGSMLSVFAPGDKVSPIVRNYAGRLSIAAINGPAHFVVSGEAGAIDEIASEFSKMEVKCSELNVSTAFHSHIMNPVLQDFKTLARSVSFKEPSIPVISNLLAKPVAMEMTLPEYWAQHLVGPVNFEQSMRALEKAGVDVFIEIGPSATLLAMGKHCISGTESLWLPAIRPNQSNWKTILTLLSQLFVKGMTIDWKKFDEGYSTQLVSLPTYPFQRQKYWFDDNTGKQNAKKHAPSHTSNGTSGYALLKRRVFSGAFARGEMLFEDTIGNGFASFLQDHRIFQIPVLPASGYMEMAIIAGMKALHTNHLQLKNIRFLQAMLLPDDKELTTQFFLRPVKENEYEFKIYSSSQMAAEDPTWKLHASGLLTSAGNTGQNSEKDMPVLENPVEVPVETHYKYYHSIGMEYGPAFQAIEQLWVDNNRVIGRIWLPSIVSKTAGDYHFHPVLLDASMQIVAAAFHGFESDDAYLPVGIETFEILAKPGSELWSYANIKTTGKEKMLLVEADLEFFDSEGNLVAYMNGLKLKRTSRDALKQGLGIQELLYQLEWKQGGAVQLKEKDELPGGRYWIFAPAGTAQQFKEDMDRLGSECLIIEPGASNAAEMELLLTQPPFFPEHILYLWGIDAAAAFDNEGPAKAIDTIYLPLLSIARFLQQARSKGIPPALWIFTQGAVPAGAGQQGKGIFGAPLWGMFRSLLLEISELRGAIIDVDPSGPVPGVHDLLSFCKTSERELAIRKNTIWRPRLVPVQPRPDPGIAIKPTAAYLITGGMGFIGLQVAEWLVKQGARYIILASRNEPGEQASNTIAHLASSDVHIRTVKADVTVQDDVNSLFVAHPGWPAINGVFHTAGQPGFDLLEHISDDQFISILAPKIKGTWYLHTATSNKNIDIFCTFSSISSVWGSKGQVHYAGANSFLDAMAWYRKDHSLPCQAINFGPWAGGGMIGKEGASQLKRQGIHLLEPKTAIEAFGKLLYADIRQAIVAKANWTQLRELFKLAKSEGKFDLLAMSREPAPKVKSGRNDILNKLARAGSNERHQLLLSYLREIVGAILKLAPSAVDVHQFLTTLGLDSLMAVEIKNTVQADLSIEVDPVMFLRDLTLDQLTSELIGQLNLGENTAPVSTTHNIAQSLIITPEKARSMLNDVDSYNEDEINQLLNSISSQEKQL